MSHHSEHGTEAHGSVSSYVIGFILSLIFTVIPYYLVVNQIVTGLMLLISILGFAMLHLFVQIIFFLHLGRGPKPRWNLYFFGGTVGAIMVVVVGSIIITNNLHHNMAPADQTKRLINSEGIYQVNGELTGACKGKYANHKITFDNGQIEPLVTVASKCDTITFIQKSGDNMEVTFGTHDNHSVYAGLSHLELRKSRTRSITLSETGTYLFHDHDRPETLGTFAVYDSDN